MSLLSAVLFYIQSFFRTIVYLLVNNHSSLIIIFQMIICLAIILSFFLWVHNYLSLWWFHFVMITTPHYYNYFSNIYGIVFYYRCSYMIVIYRIIILFLFIIDMFIWHYFSINYFAYLLLNTLISSLSFQITASINEFILFP